MASNSAEKIHLFGDEKIFTVSELSQAIKGQIEENFASLKLQGEISGLKRHSSGHTYFALKDNDSVINAICWRGTKLSIALEEGMEIVVKGRVTSYPARSQYQFIIEEANIAGEGALLKLLNERKKLFDSRGYFGNKRQLPKFPQLIGIVTSKTGAVLHDMENRLKDRYPFCQVLVWSTNVQGAGAANQVASAIRGFNFMTENRPDVLIVARGGGSIEDLWAFNEEAVVKAVFESKIPVVSGVGHEPDWTLIDYAADVRAPTPTAAIELTTPVLSDVKKQISENINRMQDSMLRLVQEQRLRLSATTKYLSTAQSFVIGITQRVDDKIERLSLAIKNFINRAQLNLRAQKLISPQNYLDLKRQKFESIAQYFNKIITSKMTQYLDRFAVISNRLEQASFRKILEKGFCFMTSLDGKIIATKEDFECTRKNGVNIHFQDGTTKVF